MIGGFVLQKQSCKYLELYSFVLLVPCQFQYFHTANHTGISHQALYFLPPGTLVLSVRIGKRIPLMLAVTRLPIFAALLVGAIAIAAALWLEARRDERRRRFMKRLESVLNDQGCRRAEEDQLKRAA